MKIDDFHDKTPAANSASTGKGKSTDKGKNLANKQQNKIPNEDETPQVDTYESGKTASVSKSTSTTNSPPVRVDRVEHARQLVRAGAYDKPEVMDKIIDRLIEAIREA